MKSVNSWIGMGAAVATGMLIASCNGEAPKQDTPAQAAASKPAPEAVVHKALFSSPAAREWVTSKDITTAFRDPADDELAWSKVARNEPYRIVEAGCTDEFGKPKHCHLEVFEPSAGVYEPERTLKVTSNGGKYDIVVRTAGHGAQTEFMICEGLTETGHDQFITGECDIYPVEFDYLSPRHKFCAHTRRVGGKVSIFYRFTHGACTLDSGDIHNGNGHAN